MNAQRASPGRNLPRPTIKIADEAGACYGEQSFSDIQAVSIYAPMHAGPLNHNPRVVIPKDQGVEVVDSASAAAEARYCCAPMA